LKKYPWQKSELELIHSEIFQTTSEQKYQILGIAQGFFYIYQVLNNHKDKTFTSLELMEIIKYAGSNEQEIKKYFERLLKDLEENDPLKN